MSEEEDQSLLDPKSSPDGLTKKGNSYNAGTKRANNVPLFVIGGFVAVFAFGAVYAGFGRGHSSVSAKKEEKHQVSAEDIAKAMLAQKPVAGTTQPASPPKMPELPSGKTDQTQATITVAIPPNQDKVPTPPQTNGMANTDNSTSDDYEQQKKQLIEQEKLAQMRLFYDSTKASSYVPVAFPRSGGSSPTQEQATQNNTIQSQMEALRQKIRENNGEQKNTPEDENKKNQWKNTAKVESPKSPYLLRAGAVIPAILITGINSGLKGFIEAQVSENVYDTATGKFLLIPQGSRLFGAYNNAIVYGQKRVLVMWNRITFPDGKTLDIGSMPGTDFAGYSGLKDQVDNHLLRLFGSALLMSAITAGINLSQQGFMGGMFGGYGYGGGMYGMNSSSVLSQSLGQGMGEAMQRLFQRNLNIAPTLKIRPGYPLNVMVSKDLTFSKPYRNFDY